jgi:hypothetical protein
MAEPGESLESTSESFELDVIFDELTVPAADLLSDADNSTRETRPYEVPAYELLDELFGDLTRTSAQFTVPVSLDELPEEAYPTEVHIVADDE